MARKRRRYKKNKAENSGLAGGIGREIVAIVLVLVAILIVIAFFNAGGFLIEYFFTALRFVLGLVTYILPTLLLYLAWRIFMAGKYELTTISYVGIVMIVLSLTALFHIGVEQGAALEQAKQGNGGGISGYAISLGVLALLNTFTGSLVLMAVLVIGLVLSTNIKLSDMIKALRERFRSEEDEFATVAGQISPKMTINAKVPLETDRMGGTVAVKEEPNVLIATPDPNWTFPSLDLLEDKEGKTDAGNPQENAKLIQNTLESFGINVAMEEVNIGPTVTQYTLRPPSGVKLSKITELAHNFELSLAAHPIRIEAPIPGKSAVGIEVPNRKAALVRLKQILMSDEWGKRKTSLSFALGRDISGQAIISDLDSMPHLLIAGATGSGKSIMVNGLLLSLLYHNSPANLKLILVDPKRVELSLYNDIPHLLAPVITEPQKCISALKWAVDEMERRYSKFAEFSKRNIAEYNAVAKEEAMPYIVIVIDELADLMMMAPHDVEGLIVRLAQKARATGIHLAVATQRPSVNVITGLIKANVPARIAFSTVSQVDSRTIIDGAGAEKLLGRGDMLYSIPAFIKPRRVQGVYTDEKEVKAVTNFLRDQREPQYNDEVLTQSVRLNAGKVTLGDYDGGEDDLYEEAARVAIDSGKASATLLQRRLRIGYARAARILEMLEDRGIVSPADGSRPRDVLVGSLDDAMPGAESDDL